MSKFDLGELLKNAVPETDTGREQIEYIDIDLIDSDDRNFYQLSDLESLAANIETVGLQQPLRVRTSDTDPMRVKIISGHRRDAALRKLVSDGNEKFRQVPCIREQATGSAALQELKLIFANSDTRKISSADLSKQAERVEQLLYQLKEEGMEFPGRMRDHVAEACKVSKTKLANLKVIRENLIPELKKAWEKDVVKEDAALKLARLPEDRQRKIMEANKAQNGGQIRWLYSNDVDRRAEHMAALDKLKCPKNGTACTNRENKWSYLAKQQSYYYGSCHKQCCAKCDLLATCKYVCPLLSKQVQAAKAKRREESAAAKAAKEEKERPDLELLQSFWRRFKEAREKAGCSIESLFGPECWDKKYGNPKSFAELEGGKITATSDAPFGPFHFYLEEAKNLIRLADFLGCSLDYLFCRTDEPDPAQIKMDVPEEGKPVWRTDPPGDRQRVLAKFDLGEGLRPTLVTVYYRDGTYYIDKKMTMDYDLPCMGWIPIPED